MLQHRADLFLRHPREELTEVRRGDPVFYVFEQSRHRHPGVPGRQRWPGAGSWWSSVLHHAEPPAGSGLNTTKPGSRPPGICLLSRGANPRGCGRGCAMFLLGNSLIVRSDGFQLWAELLALAPGARCRVGRSFGSGAPQAMQWTAITPGTSHLVRNVGAGAGSSARSWLVLRGGVVHRWSLRIPLQPRWIDTLVPATAAAPSTPLFTGGNGSS
jgi:hypothetical protein